MENKSSQKYYILAAIILVVVIVIIVFSLGSSKSAGQKIQPVNNLDTSTPSTPAASSLNTPIAPAASDTPAASASNSDSTLSGDLIGDWVSAESGKGMQGSGKITLGQTVTQLNLTSDVGLVIKKIEKNNGSGTISFNNTCIIATVSVSGKPDSVKPKQCLEAYSQPAVIQVIGNTISYVGPTVLGATVSLTGTYTRDSMSGTFIRASSTGKINGTFNLKRAKK